MSASKSGKRKHKIALPHFDNENVSQICVLLGVCFTFLTRCVVVKRTGIQGSGYFFAAYEFLVFLLLFFPGGISAAVREQFGKRFESGFYRNAKRIFNAAVIAVFFYVLVIALLWWQLSEVTSEYLLLGKTNTLPFMWLLPVFIVDALTLLLRGFLDGETEASGDTVILNAFFPTSLVFMIRQASTFVFVLIFAGVFQGDGINASRLFRNEEVKYVYGAAGVAIGFLIGAVIGFVAMAAIYFKHLNFLQRQVERDQNRRRENSNGILFSQAATAALACTGLFSMFFVAQIFAMYHFRTEAELVRSYQWGILLGICRTMSILPLLSVFLMYLGDARQITLSMLRGDAHEVRIKCQSLTEFSMLIAFFFSSFTFAAAKVICKGCFGIDSVLAVRMLRCESVTVLFLVYALATSLQLLFMQKKNKVVTHSLGAMLIGAVLLWFLLPSERLGIYAVFVATIVCATVLSFLNLLVLNRKIRFRSDPKSQFVWPFLSGAVSGAAALLLSILFGYFMPAFLSVVIIFFLSLLIFFIVGCKTGAITEYTFYGIPLGQYMERFGRMLRLL